VYEAMNTLILEWGQKIKRGEVKEAFACLVALRSLKSTFKNKAEKMAV